MSTERKLNLLMDWIDYYVETKVAISQFNKIKFDLIFDFGVILYSTEPEIISFEKYLLIKN